MNNKKIIITGGPSVGKKLIFSRLRELGYSCSVGEKAREIYREHKHRLGRHLNVGDRREYSSEVLNAFIKEYCDHKDNIYFFNRGIPDGFGWERFFGLDASIELINATRAYRYDEVFILDQVEKYEDEMDVIWTDLREAMRIHQLIVQGYIDSNYKPIYVPPGLIENRVNFILSNI